MASPTERARALGDWVCIAAFAAATLVPLAGRRLDPGCDTSTLVEERNPAPFPDLRGDPFAFPSGFEEWLGDHYGFRSELIGARNRALLLGLGVSPTDRLVVGADRWLFITANKSLEAHRGAFALSDADLRAWAEALEERRAWLAERGAHYLVVFAPDKPEIYPERLPRGYERAERTPLDQLSEHLARHSAVELVDLRPALRAARASEREGEWLYYPYGSHWTDHGAWIAYREILGALARRFPALAVPRAEDFAPEVLDEPGDTWGGRLRLPVVMGQARLGFVRRAPLRSRQLVDDFYERAFELPGDPDRPKAVLLHDSFGAQLPQYLREDFSRLFTRNTVDFERELIEAEDPDVVIQLMAERRLASYRPPVSALAGDEAARAAFAAAGEPLFALDSAAAVRRLDGWRRAVLTPGSDPEEAAVVVRLRGSGDGILLPEVELPPGAAPVLEIDIVCPKEGQLSLYYQTPQSPKYLSMRQVSRPVAAGRNVVHLDLGVADCTGRLLLMPGARGEYALRGLELRARPLAARAGSE